MGGEDFDQRLMDHLIGVFEKKYPGTASKVKQSNRALQRLRKQCELAKRALSSQTSTGVEVGCAAPAFGWSAGFAFVF